RVARRRDHRGGPAWIWEDWSARKAAGQWRRGRNMGAPLIEGQGVPTAGTSGRELIIRVRSLTAAHRHDDRPCSGVAPAVRPGANRAAARDKPVTVAPGRVRNSSPGRLSLCDPDG